MGCDIHLVIQVQESDGLWRELVYQAELHRYEIEKGQQPVCGIPIAPQGFNDRNYDLFGVLADVRNGVGFAGIMTGERWPSIAPYRGLPEGFDPELIAANPKYPNERPRWMGDHSFTWVTLDELEAFPWDSTVRQLYGCVPWQEYESLARTGDTPQSYCGDVSGPGIRVYSEESYAQAKAMAVLVERPYVRMAWPETARSATNDWPTRVLPWLRELSAGRPLRLVMGFDS